MSCWLDLPQAQHNRRVKRITTAAVSLPIRAGANQCVLSAHAAPGFISGKRHVIFLGESKISSSVGMRFRQTRSRTTTRVQLPQIGERHCAPLVRRGSITVAS